MLKSRLSSAVALAMAVSVSGCALAGKDASTGPFSFSPISGTAGYADAVEDAVNNPNAPWIIPEGFEQFLVSGEDDLNIYDAGRNDWPDMNTVNETGKMAGRFLYRTHELRSPANQPEGGSVSVVDLKTGEAMLLGQNPSWDAVDGIVWTPWQTVLFAEEKTGGRLFEIILDSDMKTAVEIVDRPAVGRLAHEGIQVDSKGNVYMVDEFRGQRDGFGGGIYRFVPAVYGDLSAGTLYVLKVLDNADEEGIGQAEWVEVTDPANARTSGTEAGGTGYNRPEDLQIIGDTLYAAITEGTYTDGSQNYDGRVIAINLNSMMVSNFVKPGLNVPVEVNWETTGLDNPDNLAATPDGRLVIVEDNVPSDIWIAGADLDQDGTADSVELFASLTDTGAEGTGIYFGKDPKTLFVNIQHSMHTEGDGTWAIRKLEDDE